MDERAVGEKSPTGFVCNVVSVSGNVAGDKGNGDRGFSDVNGEYGLLWSADQKGEIEKRRKGEGRNGKRARDEETLSIASLGKLSGSRSDGSYAFLIFRDHNRTEQHRQDCII